MPVIRFRRRGAAAVLGCAGFVLIGWTGLLVPSLIRSIERDFGQSDAGVGLFYFLYAAAYAVGSLGGGLVTERLGRGGVLTLAAVVHGAGFAVLAIVPYWAVFLAAAVPAGMGSGALDGGINGLFLDLYPTGRGRALNLLHLFFAVGALAAPLAVGLLVDAGVGWQAVVLATALSLVPLAVLLVVTDLPAGGHGSADVGAVRLRLGRPLLLLAIGIGCYVGAEVGVSNWLVRFLESAPLSVATGTLSLFWAGLTVGRLVAARIGDRFDHVRFTIVSSLAATLALVAAVLVPSLPPSIALFGAVGFAYGPIYPMIMAVGGERFPGRSAAVSGFLSATAVIGSILYPPVMGFLSVTVGLAAAMLGAALLGLGCASALALVGRRRGRMT